MVSLVGVKLHLQVLQQLCVTELKYDFSFINPLTSLASAAKELPALKEFANE